MKRLIIAGSRTFNDHLLLEREVNSFRKKFNLDKVLIVTGDAHGADTLAERYARLYDLPFKIYPANWKEYGRSAGPIRNRLMAKTCQKGFCIVFWDGMSKGTANMIVNAKAFNLTLKIINIK